MFNKPYEALTVNVFVQISVCLVNTPLNIELSEVIP